jgi:tRNA pseudouridine38-40 synthase
MHLKGVIAYDGSYFEGFQRQTRTPQTITTAIEKALKSVNIESQIIGSGRTDKGVHATGQVISFEAPEHWSDLKKLKNTLNRRLEHIAFKHICHAPENFHPRFSALRRIYRYVFKTRPPSIFESNYISHFPPHDPELLSLALGLFEGRHDFGYFHKTGSLVHSTIREIYRTRLIVRGDYTYIYFEANGFLRAQVRMMVAAAMECARGKLTLKGLLEQINHTHRHTTELAPPEGLYLARIVY